MSETEWIAQQFEANRARLEAVAYRMLGSRSEAEDAVQEAWLRLQRRAASEIENVPAWLTTVVARVCLDALRTRKSRREEPERGVREPVVSADNAEHDALTADAIGVALLVVLETLTPAERVAFVLHDLFDLPFDEIAPIVGRSPMAARQLASRARRRVRGSQTSSSADRTRQREIVQAFLAASRGGDLQALLALLAPDVVLRADNAVVQLGGAHEARGAVAVAQTFSGRARAAQLALLDGVPGLVWAAGGKPRVVFNFTIANDKITGVEMIGDPQRLTKLTVKLLE